MPESPSSLSARAQEILRRADSQLAALKAPAPPRRPVEPAPEPEPDRPSQVQDLGQLLDTVQAGIGAARAHLVTLSASLERIAQELDLARQPAPLPPELASHAILPGHVDVPHVPEEDEPEAEAEAEPEPEAPPAPEPVMSAAHEAARLVAIEMAVAGDTREGVGRRLRNEFGIRDPRSILDDAFGPEPGGPGSRAYGA